MNKIIAKEGKVVKAHKGTLVVVVESRRKHSLYDKILKKRKKLYVHDPFMKAKVGDLVEVWLSHPISKTKSWILHSIVKTEEVGESVEVGND